MNDHVHPIFRDILNSFVPKHTATSNPVVATSDLTGRTAKCSCGKEEPSSRTLPFFQYRGPGSKDAAETCVCGYYEVAHGKPNVPHCCDEFRQRGPMHDLFYCGCRGWD